jgi:aminoglycoside phosphotransferase (APT) family kinase protein
MVLRDLGEQVASSARSEDRRSFIEALGGLHGQSRRLLECGGFDRGPLRFFPARHACTHYGEWDALLTMGMKPEICGIPASALEVCRKLKAFLAAAPAALLHGDTDFSNAIVTNKGIGLIDWERACLGPASVDLSRVVSPDELAVDMRCYRAAFNKAGDADLAGEEAVRLGERAVAFDSLRWISHYVKQCLGGNDPGDDWRERYYEPCIRILRSREWAF